jgi:hypothetical protein
MQLSRDMAVLLPYSGRKTLRHQSENAMKPNTVGRASGQNPLSLPFSTPAPKVGFAPGTLLLTQDGEVPVEYLSPGDRIITRDAGIVRLEHIQYHRTITHAVLFSAGSLGHTRPDQDMILPAAQMLLIRDWRATAMFRAKQTMVRADALIDGEFIRDLGLQKMMLHQLQFNTSHVIYAGGLELSCTTNAAPRLCSAA